MRSSTLVRAGTAAVAMTLSACASTSAKDSYREVERAVEQRTGHRVFWNQDPAMDAKVQAAVRQLLAGDLAVGEAVQIALVNNRGLQAEYEELSLAQADLVQAGLLSNPTVSGGLLFPVAGGAPDIDLGVELDFLSLLFLPARKRLAAAGIEAAQARVGAEVLELAADVKGAYFRLQAAQQLVALLRVVAGAGQATAELASRQEQVGNISAFDAAIQLGVYEESRLALARAEAEVLDLREELNRLLGLWGPDTTWRVPDRLPEVPASEARLDQLEALAMRQRLDLAAARHGLRLASMSSSFGSSARWLGGLDVGAEAEREDGAWEVGPTASLQLPLFDQGHAGVARLEAEFRQARHRLWMTAVNARAEVRQARNRLVASRGLVDHYRNVVLPTRERLVRLAQEQFDAMLIGVYQLLELKRDENEAYQEYVEAVRDYWIARADLERAVGGRLPAGKAGPPAGNPPPAAASPGPAPAPVHEH